MKIVTIEGKQYLAIPVKDLICTLASNDDIAEELSTWYTILENVAYVIKSGHTKSGKYPLATVLNQFKSMLKEGDE